MKIIADPISFLYFGPFFVLTEIIRGEKESLFFILQEIILNRTKNSRNSEKLKVAIYLFSMNVKK